VTLNIQDRTEYRSEDVSYAVVIRTVLVSAVVAILISAFESLAEVVLILASLNIALVSIAARAVDVRSAPVQAHSAIPVRTSGLESLTISFLDCLSQKVRATLVGVIPTAVSIHAVSIASLHRL